MGTKFILLVDLPSVLFSHGFQLAVPEYTPGRCGADYHLEQEAQLPFPETPPTFTQIATSLKGV